MMPPLSILRIAVILLLLLIPAAPFVGPAAADTPGSGTFGEDDRRITFHFQNEDIRVFIRFVSELTGRNFLVDPRVRGTVTVISPARISAADVYAVFLSVLDVHGFTVVDAGAATKILPSADAVTKNLPLVDAPSTEDRLVTRVISLFYADAGLLKTVLTPLVSRHGALLSVSSANLLVVTDTASNISRLMKIVDAVDIEDEGTRIAAVPLRYADSREMAETLNPLFESRPGTQSAAQRPPIRFFPAERSNLLVFRCPEPEVSAIEALIRALDEKKPLEKGRIQLHRLSFARVEETAEILSSVAAGMPGVRQPVRVLADTATNSLIVDADPAQQSALEAVILQLDAPRAMVYIEALIMEVRSQRELQLGIEWSAAGERTLEGRNTFVGGGFRDAPGVSALPALVGGALADGFSLGVFTEPVDIAGVTFNNLSAILKAFREDEDVSILSTPQILATDNEEARINISRNIPFQTSTSTEQNETFNSFEYRDVGTVLTVTPHIGQKEQIRIDFNLELSAVQSTVDFRPTTLHRTLNNSVLLRSGHTLVIGGIVEESRNDNQRKVPFLGDQPAIGPLFRIDADQSRSSRFFVFLTPRIVRNPLQAAVQAPVTDPAANGDIRPPVSP